jgi:hypothetical protein
MAWIATPDFATDDVLTASNLNILSNDLEYLHGYVSGVNPVMASVVTTVDMDIFGVVRHLHNTLEVVYKCESDIRIFYDAIDVYHDGAPDGIPEAHTIDLSGFGLVVGQLYTVKFQMDSGTLFRAYETT